MSKPAPPPTTVVAKPPREEAAGEGLLMVKASDGWHVWAVSTSATGVVLEREHLDGPLSQRAFAVDAYKLAVVQRIIMGRK